jgi:hypothetical protein
LVFEPQLQGILSERDAPVQVPPYSIFDPGFPQLTL